MTEAIDLFRTIAGAQPPALGFNTVAAEMSLGESPPSILQGQGAPDGDAEPFLSANKGSIYQRTDNTDDYVALYLKVDEGDDDNDWVALVINNQAGSDMKINGVTSGSYIEYDNSADTFNIVRATSTENTRAMEVDVEVSSTTNCSRQGAIGIGVNRAADKVLATWGGNPDTGLKINVSNRAVNGTNGAVRGLDINARNRSSGSLSWIHGASITAEHSDGTVATEVIGLQVAAKNNGVNNGDVKVLRVYDESQSATGTSYAIYVDCTNNSAFTREFCMYINSGADSGWTNGLTFDGNITNAFDWVDTDGTGGATYSAGAYTPGNADGKIQVDIGGNTLWLAAYDAMT